MSVCDMYWFVKNPHATTQFTIKVVLAYQNT